MGTCSAQASPVTLETPVWTRNKGLTVTEISACTWLRLPSTVVVMLAKSLFFYRCNSIGKNSFHPEWQSRLRSLLCCLPASSSCSSALAQDLPEFISRHVMQHHCFSLPESDGRSRPAVRLGLLWCRVLHHCKQRPLSCKARVVEIFG